MFFRSNKILGLDIGSSSIKVLELEVGKKGATINSFGLVKTPDGCLQGGEIIQREPISAAIQQVVKEIKTKRKNVATNIWGSAVIVKRISMPKMETHLVAEQIKWEAEQYIPFDINEISLEYHILEGFGEEETMEVLLVAAKREFVVSYMGVIEASGLKSSIIDVSNFALANCFEFNYGRLGGVHVLLNIGARVTNFVVLENGEVTFCRDIPVGGDNFTNDIHKELGVSLEEAEALKMGLAQPGETPEEVQNVVTSTNDLVSDEIQNSFDFYLATSTHAAVDQFYVTGGGMNLPGLVDKISEKSGVSYQVMNPLLKVNYNKKKMTAEYVEKIRSYLSIGIGLGLRKADDA